MDNLLIPSAIQRIRSFLMEMSGMKVRPWATTEETLAALHETLVARQQCKIFWASLQGVLEKLAQDSKTRQEALPGTVVDNELLDSGRFQALLDEIRAALESQSDGPSTFRHLATALSAPALGLLLLLGGATTAGCDQSALHGHSTPDAATGTSGNDANGENAGTDASQSAKDTKTAQTIPDAPGDNSTIFVFPEVAQKRDVLPEVFAPTPVDGGLVTIQDIMDTCKIAPEYQSAVLSCLSTMRASWTAGLTQALVGENCNSVQQELSCLIENGCAPSASDFDPSALLCRPVMIDDGVRFV